MPTCYTMPFRRFIINYCSCCGKDFAAESFYPYSICALCPKTSHLPLFIPDSREAINILREPLTSCVICNKFYPNSSQPTMCSYCFDSLCIVNKVAISCFD